ncbi:hypothetical protein TB2_029281 [Malus domestica]|uniref:pentatricopeptide repeat-containing protein At2g28050 n=1 Tax=Malus domestica TaxID=3750 RepID=UPI003974E4E0
MSLQNVLRTLKTVKITPARLYQEFTELISTPPKPLDATTITLLSNLNPNSLRFILSDPKFRTSKCLLFFNFLLKNQSLISFKIDLHAHLTILCRLLQTRKFDDAEEILRYVSVDENNRYPFHVIASAVEICCLEPRVRAKLFNSMLKVYSDCENWDRVLETFDHMRNNGIRIDERTCTVHLVTLIRCDEVQKGLGFLYRLRESGTEVSVYSLTVVVDGLCRSGEIRRSRELVEEMVRRGTKPNIITFNTMVDACAKRWNFVELDRVLLLMEKEGVALDIKTYQFLIDGFTSAGKVEEAERLVGEMHDKGLKVNTHLYNLIISGYSRLWSVDSAISSFCTMDERSVVPNADTYWALIRGLCRAGETGLAMKYVLEMQSKGFELDSVILNSLIDGLHNKEMIYEALELQLLMEQIVLNADSSLWKKKVNGSLKLNQPDQAEEPKEAVEK